MEYFIIIAVIVLFSAGMIASYIPYSLHNISEKAGLGTFSLKYLFLKLQKIPVKSILNRYEELILSGYEVEFDEFIEYYKRNPDKFDSFIKLLSSSKDYKTLNLSFSDLIESNLREDQFVRYSEIVQIKNSTGISISKEEIVRLTDSKIEAKRFFAVLERSNKNELKIRSNEITDLTIDAFEKFTFLAEKASALIPVTGQPYIIGNEVSVENKIALLEAYIRLNEIGYKIEIDELIQVLSHNLNLPQYVNSIVLLQSNQIPGVETSDLKHFLEKGANPENIVNALIKLKHHNIHINMNTLCESELNHANFNALIENIIHPFDIDVTPTFSHILTDGLQITPEIIVSTRINPEKMNQVTDLKTLFGKINQIASGIIGNFSSYQELLKNLKAASEQLFIETTKTTQPESLSNLIIEAVKINDIEIIADKLISVKELEAVEKANELKLKILEEQKNFHEELNKKFQNGEISYKDYQKEKYIFNSNDESDLPYHSS